MNRLTLEAEKKLVSDMVNFIQLNKLPGIPYDGGRRRRSSTSRRRRSTKRRTTSRKQQKRRRGSRRAH